MNLIQSKNQYIEKIIRDKEGRLVRATFSVYENGGRIKAKLVDYVYITVGAIPGKVLSLVGFNFKKTSADKTTFTGITKSPYFNKESIYFSGSKPRAPTF